jgi:hypothetical protein
MLANSAHEVSLPCIVWTHQECLFHIRPWGCGLNNKKSPFTWRVWSPYCPAYFYYASRSLHFLWLVRCKIVVMAHVLCCLWYRTPTFLIPRSLLSTLRGYQRGSATQQVYHLLKWNPKSYCRLQQSPPLILVLTQSNPIHRLTPYFTPIQNCRYNYNFVNVL